jgi:hypothetical protein
MINEGGQKVTENKFEQELETLRADLMRIREDLAALATGARRTNGSGVRKRDAPEEGNNGECGDDGREHGEKEPFQQALHELRDRGETLLKDMSVYIKQYPVESAAMAFGFGYLFAKLLGRGGKS